MTTILIAVPTPGHLATPFFKSVTDLMLELQVKGIQFGLKTYEFSDIVASRNVLVSYFLSHPNFTHMFMVDSDMIFAPDQFLRLLEFDEEFCAAGYPKRDLSLTDFAQNIARELAIPPESRRPVASVMARSLNYNFTDRFSHSEPFEREERGAFSTVATVGTGFMLFRRSVIEKMIETGAARELARQSAAFNEIDRFVDCFSHHVDPEGSVIYGEDQSFCRRWVLGCGGKIWMDTQSKIGHVGNFTFHGDLTAF